MDYRIECQRLKYDYILIYLLWFCLFILLFLFFHNLFYFLCDDIILQRGLINLFIFPIYDS